MQEVNWSVFMSPILPVLSNFISHTCRGKARFYRPCHEFCFKCFILGAKTNKKNPGKKQSNSSRLYFYLANVSIPIQQGNEIPSCDPVELGLKAQLVQPHNNLPFISIKLPLHCVPSALIEGCSHWKRCLPGRLCYIFLISQQSTSRLVDCLLQSNITL